jgi:glucose-6-phosphate 1-dehydrogenase
MALRFGNVLFEPLWSSRTIDQVEITVAESVGLEGRLDYYDAAGALRDMVQNHMLQLLALVAMEPPARLDADGMRDEKVKVLRSLRPIDRACARSMSVIGQYAAGRKNGAHLPAYVKDLGRPSQTETFVALKAHVDNWRWSGVPFYLRTGKRLAARRTEIAIRFRPVPHSIFAGMGAALTANRLIIRLQPEEDVRLFVMVKEPGLDRDGVQLREAPLDLSLSDAFAGTRRRIAYERLLLDFIEGDPTLFVRRDEVEAQWAWIDQVRAGWASAGMRPEPYPAGSWGPQKTLGPAEAEGATWHD